MKELFECYETDFRYGAVNSECLACVKSGDVISAIQHGDRLNDVEIIKTHSGAPGFFPNTLPLNGQVWKWRKI